MSLDRIASELGELLGHTGPAAPAILVLASFIEHVFPPFPGDLLIVLGAWYAVQGVLSWPTTFAAVTCGALAGAALDHAVGRWLAPRLDRRAGRGPLSAASLARFLDAYRRWGPWLLVLNRFLPGLRAFVFVAAGAAGIPLARVLLLGGLSAVLWNGLLLAAGALLVRSLPELTELFQTYSSAAWAVVAGGIALLALGALVRWRRQAPGPEGR